MGIKFTLPDRKRDQLRDLLDAQLAAGADRVRDACNADSTWGGYVSFHEPGRHGVYAMGRAAEDAARTQRLLRNLDRARS